MNKYLVFWNFFLLCFIPLNSKSQNNIPFSKKENDAKKIMMKLVIAEDNQDIDALLDLFTYPVKKWYGKTILTRDELKLEYYNYWNRRKTTSSEAKCNETIVQFMGPDKYHYEKNCLMMFQDSFGVLFETSRTVDIVNGKIEFLIGYDNVDTVKIVKKLSGDRPLSTEGSSLNKGDNKKIIREMELNGHRDSLTQSDVELTILKLLIHDENQNIKPILELFNFPVKRFYGKTLLTKDELEAEYLLGWKNEILSAYEIKAISELIDGEVILSGDIIKRNHSTEKEIKTRLKISFRFKDKKIIEICNVDNKKSK